MKTDTEITDVIFRKEKDKTIIALFPYIIHDMAGNVMCYAHLGQHGGASYNWAITETKPAKEDDYADLKRELENHYGYNLNIVKRRNHEKYLEEYYKIRNK